MTEKLLTGTLSLNTNKQNQKEAQQVRNFKILLVKRTFSFYIHIFIGCLCSIINECDVLPMHRKKAWQIIFATFLDFCGNLVEVEKSLLASVCKLSCINFLTGFKMRGFSGDNSCLRLLRFITTVLFIIGQRTIQKLQFKCHLKSEDRHLSG